MLLVQFVTIPVSSFPRKRESTRSPRSHNVGADTELSQVGASPKFPISPA